MIVLDIEASGTEPTLHSIVSIGAVDFTRPANRFYGECRIWDGAHIMEGALAVNGFSEADITSADKQSEASLVERFLAWVATCEEHTLCGQNVSFDRDFVRHAAARAHLDCSLAFRTIDTHTLCYMHMIRRGIEPPVNSEHRRSALDLDAILQYCGIPTEPEPHNALTGALCHAEVSSRLLYSKSLLPEFASYAIPWVE